VALSVLVLTKMYVLTNGIRFYTYRNILKCVERLPGKFVTVEDRLHEVDKVHT